MPARPRFPAARLRAALARCRAACLVGTALLLATALLAAAPRAAAAQTIALAATDTTDLPTSHVTVDLGYSFGASGCEVSDYYCEYYDYAPSGFSVTVDGVDRTAALPAVSYGTYACQYGTGQNYNCDAYGYVEGDVPVSKAADAWVSRANAIVASATFGASPTSATRYTVELGCMPYVHLEAAPPDPAPRRQGAFTYSLWVADSATGHSCPNHRIDSASFRAYRNEADVTPAFRVADLGWHGTATAAGLTLLTGMPNNYQSVKAALRALAPGGAPIGPYTTPYWYARDTAATCRATIALNRNSAVVFSGGQQTGRVLVQAAYHMYDPADGVASGCPDSHLELASFRAEIDGRDSTARFTAGAAGASGSVQLAPGARAAVVALVAGVDESDVTGQRVPARDSADFATLSPDPRTAPWVVADTVRAGRTIAKDQCLTIALGPAAADECGDLRLVHALPTMRTMGTARTPVLLYNSRHAVASVLVSATVSGLSSTAPNSIHYTARVAAVGGDPRGPAGRWNDGWFYGQGFAGGEPRRLSVAVDMSADTTGLYTYYVEAHTSTNAGDSPLARDSGEVAVVNRGCPGCSTVGQGWAVAGVERLIPVGDGRLLWVDGDGSTRVYAPVAGTSYFRAAAVDRPDSLERVNVPNGYNGYIRFGPHGLKVFFDLVGHHVGTANRLGHVTNLDYAVVAGRTVLDRITLATAGAARPYYQFHYSGAGRLDTVYAVGAGGTPASARRTDVASTGAGFVTAITDPDGLSVTFAPSAGAAAARVATRTAKGGGAQAFGYDWNGAVRSSWQPFTTAALARLAADAGTCNAGAPGAGGTPADGACLRFADATMAGMGRPTSAEASASPAGVSTLYDGPRPAAVGDTTRYVLNGYGAPTAIRNALGYASTIAYDSTRFPGLATRLVRPNGFTSTAHYDARGNLDIATELDPFGRGAGHDLTTTFAYDTRWDFPVRIVAPDARVRRMSYLLSNGNLDWEQPGELGVGDTLRTNYEYTADFALPKAVLLPSQKRMRLTQTLLGNDSSATTPMGYATVTAADAYGRAIAVRTQIDTARSAGLRWQVQQQEYDAMGRVWHTQSTGDDMGGGGQITVLDVQSTYDDDGRVKTVTRRSLPDMNALQPIVTSYRYDRAGRRVAEIAADGKVDSTTYDAAGNAVEILTRRGHRITMEYTPLGQLAARHIPAATYTPDTKGVAAFSTVASSPVHAANRPYPRFSLSETADFSLAADNEIFTYNDTTGALLEADNADALVSRTYYPNGTMASERQRIRTLLGTDFTKHDYTVSYAYNDGGELVTVGHPAALGFDGTGGYSAGANFTAYTYEPITGALQTVYDRYATARYDYDRNGRVRTLARGQYVNEAFGYDDDGQLATDRLWGGNSYAARPLPSGNLRNATFLYDARGKLLQSRNDAGLQDQLDVQYSGAGQLTSSVYAATATYADPVSGSTGESYVPDAFGNPQTGNKTDGGTVNNVCCLWGTAGQSPGTAHNDAYIWEYLADGTGRLASLSGGPGGKKLYSYDIAGNTVWTTRLGNSGDDAASFYDAQNRLRAVDGRIGGAPTGGTNTTLWNFVFDEYRYDALGRRVLTRSRHDCYGVQSSLPGECEQSYVQRTVWNGSSELYEIRLPGDDGLAASALENDLLFTPNPPVRFLQGYNYYRTAFYGRVSYAYGLGTDRPVFVRRHAYGELEDERPARYFETFTWYPHWNARGEVDGASVDDGGAWPCTGFGTTQQCVSLQKWPSLYTPHKQLTFVRHAWQGSQLEGRKDQTGLVYLRNRYLDPMSGRFTQEDPIGLAGGMNAYGFAAGDPVTYSDPFGLWPWTDALAQAVANWGARHGGAVGAIALNAGAGANAALEASGINAAAEAGDKIGNGQIVQGAKEAAILIGGAKIAGVVAGRISAALSSEGGQAASWSLGSFKSSTKWANQMAKRGWSSSQIGEAITDGQSFSATNNVNPGNPATRYVHPTTGRSVVLDNTTREVIHVGGDGFKY